MWDTVGALGLPWSNVPVVKWFNRRWSFHDTQLSSAVDAAFHALAIDEERGPFRPAVWRGDAGATGQVLEQVWFAGVHSDVGGGYAQAGLSDIALRWMAERAREHGLALREGAFTGEGDGSVEPMDGDEALWFAPSAAGPVHNSCTGLYRVLPRYRRTSARSPRGTSTRPPPPSSALRPTRPTRRRTSLPTSRSPTASGTSDQGSGAPGRVRWDSGGVVRRRSCCWPGARRASGWCPPRGVLTRTLTAHGPGRAFSARPGRSQGPRPWEPTSDGEDDRRSIGKGSRGCHATRA